MHHLTFVVAQVTSGVKEKETENQEVGKTAAAKIPLYIVVPGVQTPQVKVRKADEIIRRKNHHPQE